MKYKKAFKAAFPVTVPVMGGYLLLGAGFGVFAASKGYHAGWAVLISAAMYSGSLQFVAVELLASAASVFSSAVMALSLSARHLFYGISMLKKYEDAGALKPFLIFGLTDETYSLLNTSEAPDGTDKKWFCFFVTFLNYSYWVTGTAVGGILNLAVNFNSKGIEFSMTALFVAIFTEQFLSNADRFPAFLGIGISAASLFLFGSGYFIVPSMICICAALLLKYKYARKEPINDADRI